jgi:hypothetical protein
MRFVAGGWVWLANAYKNHHPNKALKPNKALFAHPLFIL